MRTIKFRYWNTINNIMVNEPEMPFKEGWTIEQLFSDRGWIWMQFTGLLDRNGKEIYEGDIVKFQMTRTKLVDHPIMTAFTDETAIYQGAVKWGEFGWRPFVDGEVKDCEVIGDIYSNPDLISSPSK